MNIQKPNFGNRIFYQCMISNDCCNSFVFSYKCFGKEDESSIFVYHVNKPKLSSMMTKELVAM